MWRAFQSGLVSFSSKEDASLRKFHTWNVLISCPKSLPGSRVLTEERALSWPCLQEVHALSPLHHLFFLLLLFPKLALFFPSPGSPRAVTPQLPSPGPSLLVQISFSNKRVSPEPPGRFLVPSCFCFLVLDHSSLAAVLSPLLRRAP